MSIKVMTAVFDRYPNGGGEMLLALALADHASDDGTRVFPKIASLAEKTRQSSRSVQYQLRRMVESGWLIEDGFNNGGRSTPNEYRISEDWIKGAEIAPIKKGANDNTKGAIHDKKGCNPRQERVQQIAPAYNRHEPSMNHQLTVRSTALGLNDVPDALLDDWNVVRKAKKAGDATSAAVKLLQSEARKAGISDQQAIEVCCGNGWQGFRAQWYLKDAAPAQAMAQRQPMKTFDQQRREEGWARWERMSGRTHPERLAAGEPQRDLIDVTPRGDSLYLE